MSQLKKANFLANSTLFDSLKNIQNVISTRMISSTTRAQVENIVLPDTMKFNESQDQKAKELDFNNYQMAYKHMSTWEIARALFVLKLSSVDLFVDNCVTVMHYSRKILGQRLFDQVAKATFYGQFVSGDNEAALVKCVNKKRQAGIGPMLFITMEDDANASTDIDAKCDNNLRIMLEALKLAEKLNDPYPMLQIKMTGIVPVPLCKTLSNLIPEPSAQPYIIEHIANALDDAKKVAIKGLSITESEQLDKGIQRLRKLLLAYRNKGIRVLLDAEYTYINPALNMFALALMLTSYSNKPLVYNTYQNYLKKTLSNLIPEPSAQPYIIEHIANALDDAKKVAIKGLSITESEQLDKGIQRLRKLLLAYRNKGIRVLLDAEYTYINPALNMFALALMLTSYSNKPLVYNTYQNYLKSTKITLNRDIQFINSHGVGFAAKLVRGAYLEKERNLAKLEGYEDPVYPNFEDTTRSYNYSLATLLNLISKEPTKYAVTIASHNENTVLFATKRMAELEISPSNGSVFFGNTYGMCDHVSYTLGQNGYLIYKSIPYGTVTETLPYLSRRAMENRSVLNFRRERELLSKAFKDRMFRVKHIDT